mmetsp:Transcript_48790/g.130226  ORF Transcript_48790/g.130226 Transcript_48790/m.130226 type:complete len:237 (+) Transcript_48790:534-1244(+)
MAHLGVDDDPELAQDAADVKQEEIEDRCLRDGCINAARDGAAEKHGKQRHADPVHECTDHENTVGSNRVPRAAFLDEAQHAATVEHDSPPAPPFAARVAGGRRRRLISSGHALTRALWLACRLSLFFQKMARLVLDVRGARDVRRRPDVQLRREPRLHCPTAHPVRSVGVLQRAGARAREPDGHGRSSEGLHPRTEVVPKLHDESPLHEQVQQVLAEETHQACGRLEEEYAVLAKN